ncbi:reverse transcriptase domain-containing protein, partial [Trichonephila clavipes]
ASLYVDDLQISCEGSDMRMIERQFANCRQQHLKWCDTNGHSISASKSCCVLLRKRGIHPDPEIHRDLDSRSSRRTILGVIFDRRLTFLPHIYICGRSSTLLAAFSLRSCRHLPCTCNRLHYASKYCIYTDSMDSHEKRLKTTTMRCHPVWYVQSSTFTSRLYSRVSISCLLAAKSRRNHRQRASGQRGKVGDDASAASGFLSDMKRVIMHHILKIWQESWCKQLDNKLHSVKPVIDTWPVLPMRTDVKLTRLRIVRKRCEKDLMKPLEGANGRLTSGRFMDRSKQSYLELDYLTLHTEQRNFPLQKLEYATVPLYHRICVSVITGACLFQRVFAYHRSSPSLVVIRVSH